MGHVINPDAAGAVAEPAAVKDKEHAFASPSASSRWLACSAAPYIEKDLDDEPTSFAEEGSVAHHVADLCLTEKRLPSELLGQKFKSPGGMEFEVTQEMVDGVQLYLNTVAEGEAELGVDAASEIPFDIYPKVCSGTADAVIVGDRKIIVYDFKYGAGIEVDAEDNPQEMIYAVGALLALGEQASMIDEIELVIVQPRHFKDTKVKRWTISMAELSAWADLTLYPALKKIDDADFEMATGPHCQWCKAARFGKCSAVENKANLLSPCPVSFPGEVAEFSPEQLAAAMGTEASFKAWVKSVEAKYKEVKVRSAALLSGGFTVPGYKLVAGRKSPPKYINEAAAVTLAQFYGVEPYDTVVKSPAKLRDAFADEGLPTDEILALCEVKQGVEIVPLSSKKPALPVGPDAVFADID